MRRLIVLLGMVLLFTSNVYAESPILRTVVEEVKSATSDTLAMPGTITVYTHSFSTRDAVLLGAMYRTTATGSVSYKVEFEQSLWLPTTEGSADGKYRITDQDYFGSTITNQLWQVATADSLSALPYGRFKITSTTNPADAVVEISIGKQ